MRYFLEIAYNGSGFHGWQRQKNAMTVQEVMEKAISTKLREVIVCNGCGRTDTGVHARQFFLHFETGQSLEAGFPTMLNFLLPRTILAKRLYQVEDNVHARYSAISRTYQYKVVTVKNPFLLNLATFYYYPLHLEKLNAAARLLLEYNDFKAFSKTGGNSKTTICEITEAHWTYSEGVYVFTISANRFLRSMVRILTGTMLETGADKMPLERFHDILKSKDRHLSKRALEPDGLYLSRVDYPEGIFQTVKPQP
ncbi:MAG: tRNA pseudouridine(38-40) synthase TruA [Bacteroidia bacterium]